jgi:predicted transcriptional regulator
MANLILELPDDLVRRLEGIAATQRKSLHVLGWLRSQPTINW